MKVFLNSIGCRLNQSELETMTRQLLSAGHEIVTDITQAEQVIVNTCAVTQEATRDARQLTRRVLRYNQDTTIWLTGCYATIAPQELLTIGDKIQVVDNQHKAQLVQQLDPTIDPNLPAFEQEPILRDSLGEYAGNNRAFIKIQDGCDNKCTFCVTTIARGSGQSRHLGDIIAEIQTLHEVGYHEAILTGVHLGSYGHDLGHQTGLRELVKAILMHTDMPRLRLSSLEPWDIAPDFFVLWQNPRLLPHLHLPLQSGSDTVLRRMARRTRLESFRALVAEAHTHIHYLNLTTDMIVGFPGETDAEFQESLAFVTEMGFSRLHVFPYSPRPGTAAATMPHQVPYTTKKERIQQMIELGKALGMTYHQQYIGKTMPALWERAIGADEQGMHWIGYTDNYIRVKGVGSPDLFNQVTPITLTAASDAGMTGIIPNTNPCN